MIQLKRATVEDADKILDINKKAFNDEMQTVLGRDGGPPGYDNLEEHIKLINEFKVYIVKVNEIIIGSFFLIPHSVSHYSLESFCIYPEFQSKGYGLKTLKQMENIHHEVQKWSLGAFKKSIHIQKLYEKFGFIKVDEDEWEIKYEKKIIS
ncbi:MAG: GNAT family N-acetyltransferase [Spirochaetaceae bacterium]